MKVSSWSRIAAAAGVTALIVGGGSAALATAASAQHKPPSHHGGDGPGDHGGDGPGHHGGDGPGHDGGDGPEGRTLYVSPTATTAGADSSCATASYSTIVSAVSAAAPWTRVIVCQGTYAEDVVVAKPLVLIGQDATVNAAGLRNGFTITSSNVTVEGFTVSGAVGEGILAVGTTHAGPVVDGSATTTGTPITHVLIEHNIVKGNDMAPSSPSYTECQSQGSVPGDCGEGIHLMSVARSLVLDNEVTGNSGGILVTDELGPSYGNLIAGNVVMDNLLDCGITLPSHNGLAVNPATLQPNPRMAGVYDNVIARNTIIGNGTNPSEGGGAGVLMAAPFPGSASYDNTVVGNVIEGNGLSGVTMHGHAPGAYIGGNRVISNTIGVNNLAGDPSAAPVDGVPTGILVLSIATPVSEMIAGNHIFGDTYGIWLSPTVTARDLTDNSFYGVATPVYPPPAPQT